MTKTRTRLEPNDRSAQILACAVKIARAQGFQAVTRDAVSSEAGVSVGLLYSYFKSMNGLRDAVMSVAVTDGHAGVVAQGLAVGHPIAIRAPRELRVKAMSLATA